MGISFRRARPGDAEALGALAGELGYPSSAAAVRSRLERIARREAEVVFVAEAEGAVVGWVHVLEFLSLASDPCALIAGLVVGEPSRRRGIGRALVECAEGWARERGLSSIRLRSRESRAGAHAFYGRLGYRPVKRQLQFRKEL